jgi:hypothetical protein
LSACATGGVFPAQGCGTEFNHCLLAVGYNLEANPPYWILRNSWGDKWGMSNNPPSLAKLEQQQWWSLRLTAPVTVTVVAGMKGYMCLEFGKDACGVAQKSFSGLNF